MPDSYQELRPSQRLARYVECYWWRAGQPTARVQSVLPDGCVDILFSARNREPLSLTVVGLMTTPQHLTVGPGQMFFGVRFRPGMAAAFVPGAALLNDAVEPLETIWGARARFLDEQLAEASTLGEMAAVAEAFLRPSDPPDAAQRALWHLSASDSPLDRLTSDIGLSARNFRRLCVERAGVPPKYLARILRFRRTMEHIRAVAASPAELKWAEIAAAFGYFDQAHFIRDFQTFCGSTPGRFLQSCRSGTL